MSIPSTLTAAEQGTYAVGASRAAATYLRKHGSAAVAVEHDARTDPAAGAVEWTSDAAKRETAERLAKHAAAWHAEHDDAYALAQRRGGLAAVRRLYVKRVKNHADYIAPERLGTPDPEHVAKLAAAAEHAAERLAVIESLAPSRARRPRATAAKPVAEPAKPSRARRKSVEPVETAPEPSEPRKVAEPVAVETETVKPVVSHAVAETVDGSATETAPACRADLAAVASLDYSHGVSCVACLAVEPVGNPVWIQQGVRTYRVAVIDAAVAVTVAPEIVPAPMPSMTRAARKASNRELAAAMRAAGVAITPETWQAAKAGTLAELAR